MSDSGLGKYRIIAELGHGGMADVYLAVARGAAGFSKLVVIKRLRANLVDQPEFVRMLVDEARLAGRLNHPNCVQTIEVTLQGEQYYIAMEYLDGQPMHRVLHRANRESGRLPFKLSARILADSLSGLHYAHELKEFDGTPLDVVHRDATPQNIFITYDGSVKVVDFGIAKAVGRASETRAGVIKGKVAYMAPEQAAGMDVDRRADIFSVGVMLWEAAAGQRMWSDQKELQILQRLISGDYPTSPRSVNPEVSPELDRICAKALARDADDRYATAEDFRRELEAAIEAEGHRVTNRELGEYLADLFKDRREQTQKVIEKQLRELRDADTDRFENVPLTLEVVPSQTLPNLMQSGHDGTPSGREISAMSMPGGSAPRDVTGTGLSKVGAAGAQSGSALSASRSNKAFWAVGLGVGGIVAGLAIWMTRAPAPAVEAAPAVQPAPAPQRVEEIAITIRATPVEARFFIDDGPALQNPHVGRFPKDGSEHQIRIEAPGYVSRTRTVRFTDDRDIEVALDKEPTAEPAKTAAPKVRVIRVPQRAPEPVKPAPKPGGKKPLEESPW